MNNKKWIWIGMVVLFIMALMVGILSDVKKKVITLSVAVLIM